MKKLVLAVIMMLVPFSAFALDAMNEDAMDKLTGQAGVTITFENVTIRQQAADMGWTDSDGIGAGTTAGTVYIAQGGNTVTEIMGSLTIDVATATDAIAIDDADPIAADTTFVKIGLPSVSQSADAKTMTISLNSAVAAGTQVLGSLYQAGGSSSIDAGAAIYIFAH